MDDDKTGMQISEPYDLWLDAAIFTLLRGRLTSLDADRANEVGLNLMMVARAQYAVGLAFERFSKANADYERNETKPGAKSGIAVTLRRFAEVHSFLVSAALFWSTLGAVEARVNVSELSAALVDHSAMIESTKRARHHAEHINERIVGGRAAHFGGVMTPEVFRQALGYVNATRVTYGDETFDLAEFAAAIERVGKEVAPRLRELLELHPTIRIVPADEQRPHLPRTS